MGFGEPIGRDESSDSENENQSTPRDFNINKFNLEQMSTPVSILIIGKRGCGKTTLVDDFLKFLDMKSKKLFLISNTEKYDQHYKKYYSNVNILNNYNEVTTEYTSKFSKNSNQNKIFVSDNAVLNVSSHRDFLTNLLKNKKSFKTNIIVTTQSSLCLPSDIVSLFDYVFLFKDPNPNRAYEKFPDLFLDAVDFTMALDSCTSNYGQMVIDNQNKNGNFEDVVFHYRVNLLCD